MEYKAIETHYNGYRFRSRLEARWAVAFDAMGIEWQYEPEGFVFSDGTKYLPDFRLLNVRHRSYVDQFLPVWVEVKGCMVEKDEHKIKMLAGFDDELYTTTGENPVLVVGDIPSGEDWLDWEFEYPCFNFIYMDGDEYNAYFSKYKGEIWIAGADHDQFDCGKLMKIGIDAAKKARFEYGEKG